MKKLFTLLSVFCLMGVLTANAGYSVTFKFTGVPQTYSHVLIGTQNPMDVNTVLDTDTYVLNWEEYAGVLYVKAKEGYSIGTISSSVPTIVDYNYFDGNSTGRWQYYDYYGCYGFAINPDVANNGAVITIEVTGGSEGPGQGGENTYTIPVTFTPNDVVTSATFMGEALVNGNIVATYDSTNPHSSKTGYLVVNLAANANYEMATVTLTQGDASSIVEYPVANNSLSFELDFTAVTAVDVVFNEAVETLPTYNAYIGFMGVGNVTNAYQFIEWGPTRFDLNQASSAYPSLTFGGNDSAPLMAYFQAIEGYQIQDIEILGGNAVVWNTETDTEKPENYTAYIIEKDGLWQVYGFPVEANNSVNIAVYVAEEKTMKVIFEAYDPSAEEGEDAVEGVFSYVTYNNVAYPVVNEVAEFPYAVTNDPIVVTTKANEGYNLGSYMATYKNSENGFTMGNCKVNIEEGEISIEIPDGAAVVTFIVAITDIPENIQTTGVNAIGTENGRTVVYNLNGVKVLDSDNADLNSLSKGIYIVNGKKVVVK